MKKWIFLSIFIVIIIIWSGISIFQAAVEPVKNAEQQASEVALSETNLKTIEETYTYYGTEEYQVILGINDKSEKMIVWVSEDRKKVITRNQNEGITKNEAIQAVEKERNIKEIRSVKLGIENDIPIWEIIYIGEDTRLTYHKIYFETGRYRNSIKP